MPRLLKQPWHEAMLKCAMPHTEAPDRFILWSAISVLGSTLKNKVWIEDGLYKIYPNQYIVLVSPPGIGKGTAINFAWSVVKDGSVNPLVNMLSDRRTAESIIQKIDNGWNQAPSIVGQQILQSSRDHTCTIFSTELTVLLSSSTWMLDFLITSWDQETYEYDTKNSGSASIKGMCTSMVACTVPDHLRNIDRDVSLSVKGGFTSRCLFIHEDKIARDMLFPPPIKSNQNSVLLIDQLKNDLKYISSLAGGEMTYNTAAKFKFETFMRSIRIGMENDPDALKHFKSRVRVHVLKLAMILSLARKDDLIIEAIDMENAIAYVKGVLLTMEKVFRGSGDSELAMSSARVMNYIESKGMASRKELLQHLHSHMTSETLDRIIYTLTEIAWIKPIVAVGGTTTMFMQVNGAGRNGTGPKRTTP